MSPHVKINLHIMQAAPVSLAARITLSMQGPHSVQEGQQCEGHSEGCPTQ
jgi:hypothetical protein